MDWSGKKVLVLGLGDTGLSMTRWLAGHGARVSAADTREAPPHARVIAETLPDVYVTTGGLSDDLFAAADAIAISPGLDPRDPLIADSMRRGVPVVGDVEIFAQALGQTVRARGVARPAVVAITGSNGKSTVTSMTGEALRAAGRATVVAGNIGLPVLDALAEIEQGKPLPEAFVLELSSFQLETMASLDAHAATVLNVTEDHLDRYAGMIEYAAAKSRIFEGEGVQVLNRLDPLVMKMQREGRMRVTFGTDAPHSEREWGINRYGQLARGSRALMPLKALPVAGLHNAANALAALALGEAVDAPVEPMLQGLRGFRGLPHRLQKVAEIGGVTFYDDSKGTNVGATVAALNGMSVPVVLIAGGDGKGQDFSPLSAAVSARARAVVLIGRDADRIERALASVRVPIVRARTLEDAVHEARRLSAAGDAVLLSPACASYDMFRSYVHRGEMFVAAVRALLSSEQGAGA